MIFEELGCEKVVKQNKVCFIGSYAFVVFYPNLKEYVVHRPAVISLKLHKAINEAVKELF